MTTNTSRRQFLKMAGKLSTLGVAAPMGLNLASIGAAAALTNPDDYKALVCIFLYGGNDSNNMIIPYDVTTNSRYLGIRGSVGVARSELHNTVLNTNNAWDDNRSFALNPQMSALKSVFDDGKLSALMGVGTLKRQITKAEYEAGVDLPPKLMSHNDQFSLWQTLTAEGAHSGWGGRLGDLLMSQNGSNDLLTNITVGPSATFSNGVSSQEFSMGSAGPVDIASSYLNSNYADSIENAILANFNTSHAHLLQKELSRRNETVRAGNNLLNNNIQAGYASLATEPVSELDQQLDMVARIIKASQGMGVKRQVFFVGMGGFDSHNSLIDTHPVLLGRLSKAMAGFQTAIDGIGLSENVTTFTASDFGRSLTSNGDGSDHGWGGHHLIMGGALKPKRWHGTLPTLELGAADDIGQGRLLPSVSVHQYAATLANWMGASNLADVIPGIEEFNNQDLGFFS